MANNELSPAIAQLNTPWSNNENTIWLGSALSLQRNIEKFKFPGKMAPDRRQQVLALASKELLDSSDISAPVLLKAEDMTPLDKEYLTEHFLTLQTLQHAHAGEGFLIDASGSFLTTFNLLNHLHFTILDTHGDLEKASNRLVSIESGLGQILGYAYSSKFGFLTADPHQCGTAFTVSAFLQLPALAQMGELETITKKLQDDQLVITGIQGSPTEIIGDVISLQNNYTLGVTEENILSSLRSAITKLQVQENSARLRLKEQERPEIKDHVARAFGILMHSYQIETIEALNAISLIKLGVDLHWVNGVTIAALNQLFFSCRRAHLLGKISGALTSEEIPHKRAEHIHKTLKNVSLAI